MSRLLFDTTFLVDADRLGGSSAIILSSDSTIPIIDYDATVAASHAQLLVAVRRRGRPRGAHNLIIAATANATQREVLSADLSAYQDLPGVRVRH